MYPSCLLRLAELTFTHAVSSRSLATLVEVAVGRRSRRCRRGRREQVQRLAALPPQHDLPKIALTDGFNLEVRA